MIPCRTETRRDATNASHRMESHRIASHGITSHGIDSFLADGLFLVAESNLLDQSVKERERESFRPIEVLVRPKPSVPVGIGLVWLGWVWLGFFWGVF